MICEETTWVGDEFGQEASLDHLSGSRNREFQRERVEREGWVS